VGLGDRLMARLDSVVSRAEADRTSINMHYVYVLKSRVSKKSYIGKTNNMSRRIKEHNVGKNIFTKRYLPWDLVYYEEFMSEKEAINKEKYYKSHTGRNKLKVIFNKYYRII